MYKNNVDIEYCDYDDINKKVKRFIKNEEYKNYGFVYITDISINKEVAELIENTQPDTFKNGFHLNEMFQLLDHHTTAEWLNEYWWATISATIPGSEELTCGTSLLLDHLKVEEEIESSKTLEEFVEVVRKYDTWLWKTRYNDNEPKKWNDLLYLLGRDNFIDKIVTKIEANIFELSETDKLILDIEQNRINAYIYMKNKEIERRTIDGYIVGIVFAEQYPSELGNILCEQNPDIDIIAIVNMSKSISYRGIKDEINIGKNFATLYGGGGHSKAAGSPIPNNIRKLFLDELFSK